MNDFDTKLITFYLPQFHPIPENDEWWGKGFTEWINVAQGRPRFKGHYQPHIPADMGFYDLRLPQAREEQAKLAAQYGIHGFCYYHYWFNGKRLLEQPFNGVLESGDPDFPFCLCWANEEWTRAWDGRSGQVLLGQNYGDEDDRNHIEWLLRAFADPRYIRIDGKPLFLIYRTSKLPNPKRTAEIWREAAQKSGIGEIMLGNVQSFVDEYVAPSELGFDVAIEFQPRWRELELPFVEKISQRRNLRNTPLFPDKIYNYDTIARKMMSQPMPDYDIFRCVTPQWDNSARRKKDASILAGSTPAVYYEWLKHVIEATRPADGRDHVVFINAWNEWGEGCHLEPCQKWGRAYLEATLRALNDTKAG